MIPAHLARFERKWVGKCFRPVRSLDGPKTRFLGLFGFLPVKPPRSPTRSCSPGCWRRKRFPPIRFVVPHHAAEVRNVRVSGANRSVRSWFRRHRHSDPVIGNDDMPGGESCAQRCFVYSCREKASFDRFTRSSTGNPGNSFGYETLSWRPRAPGDGFGGLQDRSFRLRR